mmetsp:Transcript_67211/g.105027  ORF Transcript_67211/g.105027 Transcript_67211/m.105027 type:complete len:1244 (+) Transcript_67211:1-3732(+)
MDWATSSEQKFYLYNKSEGDTKWYEPENGSGFAQKDSVCLLSLDVEEVQHGGFGRQYGRQNDGAIVQIHSAEEKKPLFVKLRTPVTVPFNEGAIYRLDDLGVNDLAVNRLMEALSVLGNDSIETAKKRAVPHPYLFDLLMLPAEEPLIAHVNLQPKVAPLNDELENVSDLDAEPIRVRDIGSGALLAWNKAHPSKAIRVGDRIVKVNDAEGKEAILAELRHAHDGWTRYGLSITFMRNVRARDHGVQDNMLERRPQQEEDSETIDEILRMAQSKLSSKLNKSQMDALKLASTRRVALIQGPPGTGKTTTAVEIVSFLLEYDIVPRPILVTGHTNPSVDNLLVGLARKGKRVMRLGGESNNSKIRDECKSYLVNGENAADLEEAEVICATCSGSASGKLKEKGIYCHTVLIDEGSQATESSCLIPLCRGAEHLIIVGDQCQLEPMVKSDFAKREQLGASLFNRFYKQGITSIMLNTQHRMHPFICEFASAAFYSGQLLTGVNHSERIPSAFWEWPCAKRPVCFVDVRDGVEVSTGDKIVNKVEALQVKSAVSKLLMDPDLKVLGHDGTYPVAVVTGYAAQKDLIEKQLIEAGFADKEEKCLIEVNTVDAFQGREKSVIIFSAVRANYETVGFLRDWRRLNVMLTRARNGLIVFGHRATLQHDYYWGHWLRWASSNGCIMGEDGKGKWVQKCLLPKEWIMTSSEENRTAANHSRAEGATCDSWEDPLDTEKKAIACHLESGGFALDERTETCTSMVTCDAWEDLTDSEEEVTCNLESGGGKLDERTETCNSTITSVSEKESSRLPLIEKNAASKSMFTCDSWEEYDTSSEVAAEEDITDASESSFYSQSEYDLSECPDDMCMGPLDRIMHDRWSISNASGAGAPRIDTLDSSYSDVLISKQDAFDTVSDEDIVPHSLVNEYLTDDETDFDCPSSAPYASEHSSTSYHCIDKAASFRNEDCAYTQFSTVLMPMLVPFYPSITHVPSLANFTSMPQTQERASVALNPITYSQPHYDMVTLRQSIVQDFASEASILCAEWFVDSQKLSGSDRSIVSPAIELPPEVHGDLNKAIVFKLMLCSRGNGFAKSQGVGHIQLRCERPVRDPIEGSFSFKITLGNEVYGPVTHDFYSRSIADMPNKPACKFKQAVDTTTKKLAVRLEIWSGWDVPGKNWSDENTLGLGSAISTSESPKASSHLSLDMLHDGAGYADISSQSQNTCGMGRRGRSEAGRQKQYERWQRRKQEKNNM